MKLIKPTRSHLHSVYVTSMKPPQADFVKDAVGRPTSVAGYKLLVVTETGVPVEYPCSAEIYRKVDKGGKNRTGMDTDPDSQFVLYVDGGNNAVSLDVIPEQKYQNSAFLRPSDFDEKRDVKLQFAEDGSVVVTQRPYDLDNGALFGLLDALNAVGEITAGQSFVNGAFRVEAVAGNEVRIAVDTRRVAGTDDYTTQEQLLAGAVPA